MGRCVTDLGRGHQREVQPSDRPTASAPPSGLSMCQSLSLDAPSSSLTGPLQKPPHWPQSFWNCCSQSDLLCSFDLLCTCQGLFGRSPPSLVGPEMTCMVWPYPLQPHLPRPLLLFFSFSFSNARCFFPSKQRRNYIFLWVQFPVETGLRNVKGWIWNMEGRILFGRFCSIMKVILVNTYIAPTLCSALFQETYLYQLILPS